MLSHIAKGQGSSLRSRCPFYSGPLKLMLLLHHCSVNRHPWRGYPHLTQWGSFWTTEHRATELPPAVRVQCEWASVEGIPPSDSRGSSQTGLTTEHRTTKLPLLYGCSVNQVPPRRCVARGTETTKLFLLQVPRTESCDWDFLVFTAASPASTRWAETNVDHRRCKMLHQASRDFGQFWLDFNWTNQERESRCLKANQPTGRNTTTSSVSTANTWGLIYVDKWRSFVGSFFQHYGNSWTRLFETCQRSTCYRCMKAGWPPLSWPHSLHIILPPAWTRRTRLAESRKRWNQSGAAWGNTSSDLLDNFIESACALETYVCAQEPLVNFPRKLALLGSAGSHSGWLLTLGGQAPVEQSFYNSTMLPSQSLSHVTSLW